MRFLLALFAAALTGGFALAETCGGPEAPCEMPEGGEYHVALPEGEAKATLIFLHGFGGRGEGVIKNKGLLKPILARGYAVVAPQGLPFRPNSKGGAWNSFDNPKRRNDVAFLNAVADDATRRFSLNRSVMIIGGFSGGGMMTWRVACNQPGSFAAYAPIAGLLWRPLPADCDGPIRMHHTHGWSDPVVPIEGRTVGGGFATQGDLFEGLDLIRRVNGCAKDDPDEYSEDGIYLSRKWTTCTEGSALEMALHPGGHRIPKGWSTLAMDWFEALPPAISN